MWLLLVWFVATVALVVAGSRVGANANTTYGSAEQEFEASWGGHIALDPPRFWLDRQYTEQVVDKDLKAWVTMARTERIPLLPTNVVLTADIRSGVQRSGWLTFDAYEVRCKDTYTIRNTSGYAGSLLVEVDRPEAAALVYDYTLAVAGELVPEVRLGAPFPVVADFAVGAERPVNITLSTKGVETYQYALSNWKDQVLPHLDATLTVDSDRFSLLRFGLPHTRSVAGPVTTVHFDVGQFSSNEDLGITFAATTQSLDRVAELVGSAPIAVGLFLAVLFVWSQLLRARFNAFFYLFAALTPATYFLFLSYAVRYFGLVASFSLSAGMMLALFALTVPSALGRSFALRVALPYLLVLTLGFSGIFLLPVFKGVAFLGFAFVVGLSVLVPVARANLARWPIIAGWPAE